MNITRRFIYLLCFGILLLVIGAMLNISFSIFIVYNLLCALLLLIDYFISPGQEILHIERRDREELSIYEREAIEFEVYNKGDSIFNIELIDEVPEFNFETGNKLMKGFVNPHEKKLFQYFVTPTKRGAYKFGNVHVRYEGKLKLCAKQFKLDLDKEYKVYPNLKNLRKYRMSITNNRQLKQGEKSLRMLGRGTSFESLREYVAGDEYRKINWQATARENKPIVNQYEPEKNQHVHIFIDTGRPMSYSVRGYRKLDLAVNTALVLSDIVNQNGDQSALLIFNTEVSNMLPPGKGAGHRNQMLEELYHIDYTNQTSNYEEAFYYFKRKERHRSIVFLFTDFETVEEAENMLRTLPVISKNNLVVIMLIRNESLESLAAQKIKNQQELFDKGVALELLNERKKIKNLLNRRGIYCLECEAEKIEVEAINQYIRIKNKTFM
ncbi:DUF58 domain-containing protein [Clostridium swellfunianum]|uniref:DUF58 domain-containing protein n=1 Tax=Clostridium swellfunianum TaxID=1367462 RepID=UPI002030580D|nr:DUF58 domain-containing protein [Clostridium swellfunianum]MCM0647930.1 DUF58 domain-containing protein [Clostridium swellfunianum]